MNRGPGHLLLQEIVTRSGAGLHASPPLTATYPRNQQYFPPGRFAGLRRMLGVDPARYARSRNHLDGAVTALSPYLTHGLITETELAAHWRSRFDLTLDDKLLMELAWRTFFREIWRHQGERIFEDLQPPPFPDVAYHRELPQDILTARTGLPVIDETIRRLYADGYLHNHQRMWLASYCVHIRKLHWRTGADWLYGHLLDGDLASNHLSWQWVAGTFSTKPYLFNDANVARFAPSLSLPGSLLDRSYEALAELAASTHPPDEPERRRVIGPPTEPPRLLSRTQRFLPPVDFERLARDRHVALIHPWSLDQRPPAERVIGIFHLPFHARFPWSAQRWDFVTRRMSRLCDAIWAGDLTQLAPILARAASVSVRTTLYPGYASALACLPVKPSVPEDWLPPAPDSIRSFSAYLRHLRKRRPDLFREPPPRARRLHAPPRGHTPGTRIPLGADPGARA